MNEIRVGQVWRDHIGESVWRVVYVSKYEACLEDAEMFGERGLLVVGKDWLHQDYALVAQPAVIGAGE